MGSALLIDLDGVVREWPPQEADRIPGLPPDVVRKAMFAPDLLERAVTGAISDEQWQLETAEHLFASHGVDCRDALLAARSYPGRVRPEVVDICRRVRAVARVCLITNATTRLDDHLDQLKLTDEFDQVFNSSTIGVAKPDARVFQHACNQLGLAPTEVVFVDDNAGHVNAAAAAGLRSHLYTTSTALEELLTSESLLPQR